MTRHSSRLALALNTSYSPAALCVPVRPHGIKTHPEVDQQQGATRPLEFSSDVESRRILSEQLCGWKHEFALHAMSGQLSNDEANRIAHANASLS